MRIAGGRLKNRRVTDPKSSAVRPMSDKVRAALFDILGDVEGLALLDAYAGSGAVGIEAISRGAGSVTGIEKSRPTAKVIKNNLQSLGIDNYDLYTQAVSSWLNRHQESRYDIITADPPYAALNEAELALLGGHLREAGVMAVSHSSRRPAPELDGLVLMKTSRYGDSVLSFYGVD